MEGCSIYVGTASTLYCRRAKKYNAYERRFLRVWGKQSVNNFVLQHGHTKKLTAGFSWNEESSVLEVKYFAETLKSCETCLSKITWSDCLCVLIQEQSCPKFTLPVLEKHCAKAQESVISPVAGTRVSNHLQRSIVDIRRRRMLR